MKSRKVAIFTGTRAEYGLLYWLMKDIKEDADLNLQVLVSGSHLSPEFGLTYQEVQRDGFEISEMVEFLLSSDTPVGMAKSMGLAVIGFADALARMEPDIIVILGDRYEALAAAQTAMIMNIPILHIHGGEITEGAYDDAIRHAITKLSYLHATATDEYMSRVIQLGESPDRVFNVGAIGLDHLQKTKFLSKIQLSVELNFDLIEPYFLLTYHSATLGEEDPVIAITEILKSLDRFPDYKVIITYPNADTGGRKIIPLLKNYANLNADRVYLTASLGQQNYLSAVKYAAAVIGNSSSGIIEVPAFRVPTINIGSRQKGRLCADSILHCKIDETSIVKAIKYAISKEYILNNQKIINPYGEGNASASVMNIIKNMPFVASKGFYDIKV